MVRSLPLPCSDVSESAYVGIERTAGESLFCKRWMFHRAEGWDADAKTRNFDRESERPLNSWCSMDERQFTTIHASPSTSFDAITSKFSPVVRLMCDWP